MNQWAFVIAAYAVALLAVAGLLVWAVRACLRAEKRADEIGRTK